MKVPLLFFFLIPLACWEIVPVKPINITDTSVLIFQHVPKGLLSLVQIIMPYLVHAPLDSKGFILNPDCISVIQQSNILEVYHLQLTLELKHLR